MTHGRDRSPELRRLAAFGTAGGPDVEEALRLFADLRATPEERSAVEELLDRDAHAALPDALLVAVATALVDRGEDAAAARVLVRSASSPALVLRAEIVARAGDRAGAIATLERVLRRDLDWPGARERHARWLEELGAVRPRARRDDWETLAIPAPATAYEIVREVGRGGAAVVYEAQDRELGRRVALKVYHQPERDRPQLLHEARVAVALTGPGVVHVFDVDPEQGWIALEWASLGPLSGALRTAPLSLRPVRRWAAPLAGALARVHASGWVHHDLKPSNVLLTGPSARPVLGDFGSARRRGEASPPGSLGYVSPERLAGRESDPRDDVYAFGRVLDDVLDALDAAEARADASRPAARGSAWRDLAGACTGPDDRRPRSGAELATLTAGAGDD